MFSKTFFALCSQVLFIQTVFSQCTSPAAVFADPAYNAPCAASYGMGAPYGYPASYLNEPYGYGTPFLNEPYGYPASYLNEPYGYAFTSPYTCSALEYSPTSGGSLAVTSTSGIPPVGVSVVSDNVFEGLLAVAGELPFVGTVTMDGAVPSFGAGVINHACGNGVNAMVSDIAAYAPGYDVGYGPISAIAPGFPTAYGYDALGYEGLGYEGRWLDRGCGCGF